MRRSRILFTAGALLTLASVAPAENAAAGSYYVRTCQAPGANFSERLFTPFATRSMGVSIDCNPEGGVGNKGWRVGSLSRRRASRVPYGGKARLALYAPKSAHFSYYRWSGDSERADCGFSLASFARGPRGSTSVAARGKLNYNATGGRCRDVRRGRARASALPRSTAHVVGDARAGATELQHVVACHVRRGCTAGGTSIEVYSATAQVVDYTRPVVQSVGGALASGKWVGGSQPVSFRMSDNVGVRATSVLRGNVRLGPVGQACDHTRLIPCPSGPTSMRVGTGELREGSQPLVLEAVDSAGNVGHSSPVVARVDNTPPPRVPVGVVGGEGWRRTPAFTLGWANPSEGDRAPIAAAHYRLCTKGMPHCKLGRAGRGSIASFTLSPGVGEHTVTVWREDAAGNQQADNESTPVTLRYDPEVPQAAFKPQSPSDPTSVAVAVTDKVSGLGGGAIEISRVGSRIWQTLPTAMDGSHLRAKIDDSRLPRGQYALRARALDKAGNETSTDRRTDGYAAVVSLPARVSTNMRAGVLRRKSVRRRGHRGMGARRRVTVLLPARRVRFGRRVMIAGRLWKHGGGIAGARIHVFSRTPTSREQLAGVVLTDRTGRLRFKAAATSTRILRLVYGGTRLILPAQREVTLRVPAASSMHVTRRRVRNGGSVVFRGRLHAAAAGKLVELQVRLSGRYQTFLTTRTDSGGRWTARYRFRRSCGITRYRFRARVPKEMSYPFETGRSRARGVRVRGLRCG